MDYCLAGLGHLSAMLTVYPFVRDLFKQSDTEVLVKRFDKIDNNLEEIKYRLSDMKNELKEQEVRHNFLGVR